MGTIFAPNIIIKVFIIRKKHTCDLLFFPLVISLDPHITVTTFGQPVSMLEVVTCGWYFSEFHTYSVFLSLFGTSILFVSRFKLLLQVSSV